VKASEVEIGSAAGVCVDVSEKRADPVVGDCVKIAPAVVSSIETWLSLVNTSFTVELGASSSTADVAYSATVTYKKRSNQFLRNQVRFLAFKIDRFKI
jgi:hypothetical protein